jgi:hypothetical protein
MSYKLADFVRETSTSTGTGEFSLDGAAAPNFRTFDSVFSPLDTFIYSIRHRTLLEGESGIGQFTASGTILRQTILESTNGDAAVSFSAGTKDCYIAPSSKNFPALLDGQVWQGVTGSVPIPAAMPVSTKEAFWRYDASIVMADPGAGKFRGNASTPAASTVLAISATTDGNTDVSNALKALTVGDTVQIQDKNDSTNWARFTLSGAPVNNGTWFQLPLTYVSGGGSAITNNTLCVLSFSVAGSPSNLTPPVLLASPAIGVVPLTLKGFVGQTASLLELQDSAGGTLSSIGPNGRFRVPDGLVTSAGLQFQADPDTGLYRSATNTLQIVAGGAAIITIAPGTIDLGGNVITTGAIGVTPLIVKGIVGQTAPYFEIKDSGNTTRLSMNSSNWLVINSGIFFCNSSNFQVLDLSSNTILESRRTTGWTDAITVTRFSPGLGIPVLISSEGAAFTRLGLLATTTQVCQAPNTSAMPVPLAASYALEVINAQATNRPILALREFAGQTANALDVLDSANVVLASITASGGIRVASAILATAALATNATAGFTYIPSCPGTPTGVPTAQTGTVAMVYDSSANKLWIYNGSWRSATFA